MQETEFNNGLLDFIQESPTPFHAVSNMVKSLEKKGFTKLLESDVWDVTKPGQYYVTRNDSSIIAFTVDNEWVSDGVRMVGAHTDSPCLKVKPNPVITKNGYLQLGVEVYGGVLLHTWFDRDLSLAGRVNFIDANNQLQSALIDFKEAIAFIPSLAIHLDSNANEEHTVNKQQHLPPILMKIDKEDESNDFKSVLLKLVNEQYTECQAIEVLDYELSFYDVQAPAIVGLKNDFVSSARLDNLLSCYTGLQGLLNSDGAKNTLLVCTDHEEVGSASTSGAQGTFIKSVIERISGSAEDFARTIDSSMMISADNAHGVHPNFSDVHDGNHGPILNEGPVIKMNANQRYATNSETTSVFKQICRKLDVPVQSFVVRSDMACGSTIGPITATELGVRTLDIGVPTFGMHSIRELAGSKDAYSLFLVLRQYFS